MPILHRDQSEVRFHGTIERIGVALATGPNRTYTVASGCRMRFHGHDEVIEILVDGLPDADLDQLSQQDMDELFLSMPGDEVEVTLTRRFGLVVPSGFVNLSYRRRA